MNRDYNIAFACDEYYVKFTSVAIASIIHNTRNKAPFTNNSNEKYIFSILTNGFSDVTIEKLNELEKKLNLIFPCEIKIHILSDEMFRAFKLWSGNYMAYYRLYLSSIFSHDIDKILYLDSDLIVASDIRELFEIDFEDKTIGVVRDVLNRNGFRKKQGKGFYYIDTPYFNSGFLLINYKKWIEENIEEKAIQFLHDYETRFPDQDALNSVVKDKLYLAPSYNLLANLCVLQLGNNIIPLDKIFSDECFEIIENSSQIHIIHYAGTKPWYQYYTAPTGKHICYDVIAFTNYWWHIAEKTPIFCDEILLLKNEIPFKESLERTKKEIDFALKGGIKYIFYHIIKTVPRRFELFYRYQIENPIKRLFRR